MNCKNGFHTFPKNVDYSVSKGAGKIEISVCNDCLATRVEMKVYTGSLMIVTTKVVEPDEVNDSVNLEAEGIQ